MVDEGGQKGSSEILSPGEQILTRHPGGKTAERKQQFQLRDSNKSLKTTADLVFFFFSVRSHWLFFKGQNPVYQADHFTNAAAHMHAQRAAQAGFGFETDITYLAGIHVQYKGRHGSVSSVFLEFCLFLHSIT